MKMFEDEADELFQKAGLKKTRDTDFLWRQCTEILSEMMATTSVTMGLSYKRVGLYEKQKRALLADLRKYKAGKL